MPDQLTALRLENERLAKENELAKKIATRAGFFNYYFNVLLPKYPNRKAAFEFLDGEYVRLFDESLWGDYESFRVAIYRWLKEQSK